MTDHKLAQLHQALEIRDFLLQSTAFLCFVAAFTTKCRHPLLRICQHVVDVISTTVRAVGVWAHQLLKLRLRLRDLSWVRLQSLCLVYG